MNVEPSTPNAQRSSNPAAANNAKAGCLVSRVLNAKITMDAKLES